MDELKNRLQRYMIRRTKEEVLPELPKKIITDVPFKLNDEEKKLYTKIKKELLFEIEKMDISKINNPATIQYTLVKMTRLRMLADSMELLGEKQISSKLDVLKELLIEAFNTKTKVIIFSQFATMCKILKRELKIYNPLMLIGETPSEKRREIVKVFNEDNEHKVLILSEAGQYGLNLQSKANIIINYDMPWSISKYEQRIGRAHRIGQEKTVFVYNLLAKGTVDEYVYKILISKTLLANEILGDVKFTMGNIKQMLI